MTHMHYFTLEQREALQRQLERRAAELRGARAGEELRAVESALARLHQPDFGVCVDCEADIPFARLQADPSALRCSACEARAGRPAA
jgi:RNA polymerase-binding transcription factor DksA